MEKLTNWLKLWQQLAEVQGKAFSRKKEFKDKDFWKHKAKHFQELVEKRWENPDSQ